MKEETALATTTTGGALAFPSDMMADMAENAGMGTDYAAAEKPMPYISVLQALSPQVQEQDARYIDGAKPGMIYNNLSKTVVDVRVITGKPAPLGIPIVFGYRHTKMLTEWVPRDNGGGFVAHHLPNSSVIKLGRPRKDGKVGLELPNGNHLIETDYHYAMLASNPENPVRSILALSSTGLRTSRELIGFVDGYQPPQELGLTKKPPLYSMMFTLRTAIQTKKDKQWWGTEIHFVGLIPQVLGENGTTLYKAAREFAVDIKEGNIRLGAPPIDEDAGKPAAGSGDDENVPF